MLVMWILETCDAILHENVAVPSNAFNARVRNKEQLKGELKT